MDHLLQMDLVALETEFEARVTFCVPASRSALASRVGVSGMRLQPRVDALREVILEQNVVHADEAWAQMLAPGSKRAHLVR